MARTAKDGLSRHPTHGFRLTIGKKADGKPRLFWLGKDRAIAEYHADTLKGQHDSMKFHGREVWTPDDETVVKQCVMQYVEMMRGVRRMHIGDMKRLDDQRREVESRGRAFDIAFGDAPAAEQPAAPDPVAVAKPMLYAAIKAYVANIKGKRTSDKHKERAAQVVETNLKRARKDCPLAEIDFVWLDSLCDHYKARPKNLKEGTPLAPGGVKNVLTYLRLFFTWLDDTEYGGWEAPRKMLKCFKVRIADLMTTQELREVGIIKQFDTATLAKLYKTATDRQRAWMLTALFTGATQQELAVMEQAEFDLDKPRLVHLRNKTKVQGEYWLPPELVTLLRAEFKPRPNDSLAFRTAEGNPLVTFKDGRQTSDAVRQSWDDLRVAAELPDALSFKYLRKFLADWMTRHGGEEIGQVAMSHSRQSVLSRNYTSGRPFDRFNEFQRQMHAELKKAKVFEVPVKEKVKAKTKAKAAA